MDTNIFPKILTTDIVDDRNIDFRNALFTLNGDAIDNQTFTFLTKIYNSSKLPEIRYAILVRLYDKHFKPLKQFFDEAFKRERYPSMKIQALRGLCMHLDESHIAKLTTNLRERFSKSLVGTPYQYIEFEYLRGENALPFLFDKYGYQCFKSFLNQLDIQYSELPAELKGHFKIDKNGNIITLRSPSESKLLIDSFFKKHWPT